eukprot:1188299-Prorocentrum_minimum.AAC.4
MEDNYAYQAAHAPSNIFPKVKSVSVCAYLPVGPVGCMYTFAVSVVRFYLGDGKPEAYWFFFRREFQAVLLNLTTIYLLIVLSSFSIFSWRFLKTALLSCRAQVRVGALLMKSWLPQGCKSSVIGEVMWNLFTTSTQVIRQLTKRPIEGKVVLTVPQLITTSDYLVRVLLTVCPQESPRARASGASYSPCDTAYNVGNRRVPVHQPQYTSISHGAPESFAGNGSKVARNPPNYGREGIYMDGQPIRPSADYTSVDSIGHPNLAERNTRVRLSSTQHSSGTPSVHRGLTQPLSHRNPRDA